MNRDIFEMQRALDAKRWLDHPDRVIENIADRAKREKSDIKLGHSTKCTLSKCHHDCSKHYKGA
jgi:hypothetical protein